MTKLQSGVIFASIVLFFGLYFGCTNKPPELAAEEQKRAVNMESADINAILQKAKNNLSTADNDAFVLLEQSISKAENDSLRINALKELSGSWYGFGQFAIAGYYAEKIAEILNTESAWSIAGTTYGAGMKGEEDDRIKKYCSEKAINAFEFASSLNPKEAQHKVNLAVCYAEFPPANQPMKGILMLLDLNKKDPNNTTVLLQLGRLGIQTGQFDKAKERLEKVLQLDPKNTKATCLLVEVYQGLNDLEKAEAFSNRCKS